MGELTDKRFISDLIKLSSNPTDAALPLKLYLVVAKVPREKETRSSFKGSGHNFIILERRRVCDFCPGETTYSHFMTVAPGSGGYNSK